MTNPPAFLQSQEFKTWEKRALTARTAMLTGKSTKFTDKIWQDFKNDFLVPIGRCAYCEGRYTAGEFGDAEHYRPKSEVTEARNPVKHPGYFWLAYEWHNLLLSCKKCNSKHRNLDLSTKNKAVHHPGKLCEFPVKAPRITGPSQTPGQWMTELLAEDPLLLHPYYDDPSKHFMAKKDGWICHRTDRGERTVEVCDLNRQELRIERKIAEDDVMGRAARMWVLATIEGANPESEKFGPEHAFSTYLNGKLDERIAEFKSRLS